MKKIIISMLALVGTFIVFYLIGCLINRIFPVYDFSWTSVSTFLGGGLYWFMIDANNE